MSQPRRKHKCHGTVSHGQEIYETLVVTEATDEQTTIQTYKQLGVTVA